MKSFSSILSPGDFKRAVALLYFIVKSLTDSMSEHSLAFVLVLSKSVTLVRLVSRSLSSVVLGLSVVPCVENNTSLCPLSARTSGDFKFSSSIKCSCSGGVGIVRPVSTGVRDL